MTHADTSNGGPGAQASAGMPLSAWLRPLSVQGSGGEVVGKKDKWRFNGRWHDRSWRGNPSRRRQNMCYVTCSHYLLVELLSEESPAALNSGGNIVKLLILYHSSQSLAWTWTSVSTQNDWKYSRRHKKLISVECKDFFLKSPEAEPRGKIAQFGLRLMTYWDVVTCPKQSGTDCRVSHILI